MGHTPHTHSAQASKGAARPEPIDPERDIDAKPTALWFIGSSIVFFVSFYFLMPLFDRVLTQERNRKVDLLPNTELMDVKSVEQAFLRGDDSKSKKSIEQVMKEMAAK
jgi:beta-lactamase regulating signal transducer with metallopeptidase domain